MRLSLFGEKLTGKAGILSLMDDLGQAVADDGREMIMMGGGNPGLFPPVQDALRRRLAQIASEPTLFHRLMDSYAPPGGDAAFLRLLADRLGGELGWPLSADNLCLTNGSQSAFFMLMNLFAGDLADGRRRKILLPLAPEYIGYADLGINDDFFIAARPDIELLPDNLFKYHVDFAHLPLSDDIGALCLSRPTNPTGNLVTEEELQKIDQIAQQLDIPLIIDGAYGPPFPSLVHGQARPYWNERVIFCLSLSKFGLPSIRCGIIVANPEIIRHIRAMNAILALSPSKFGPMLIEDMLASGEIFRISRDGLRPFYRGKMEAALDAARRSCADAPYRIHKPEGAFFLWFCFPGLPVSSLELYRRLKKRGVVVVSGHYFFPGLPGDPSDWPHSRECIRVTYAQDEATTRRGIEIIAEETRAIFNGR
ncbi:MAG: valine--pyruvate transaminase [Desulfobulbaceae bacterium]|jgi:valine--pyruvate aminotransferase|nr:valine--pyruvate transaminase [Desulfobulbaceae bacterium]